MKLLLALTGASGVVYGKRTAEVLAEKGQAFDLIISESAKRLINIELEEDYHVIAEMADNYFEQDQMEAPPASGSSLYDAMVIMPTSMSTLSKISAGISDNLITRSATVMLKEGRRLILVPRETPLSTLHLDNMNKLSSAGVIVLPASPGFYGRPKKIEDLIDFVVGKVLDTLDIENQIYRRWRTR